MSPIFIGVVTPFVGLVGLTLVDSFNLYFIAPSVLWIAFSASSIIKFTKKFMIPLWVSRSFQYFTAFSIFTSTLMAYSIFANKMEYDNM